MPPKSPQVPRMLWSLAANYSNLEWSVYKEDGKPSAKSGQEAPAKRPNQPKFTPKAGKFDGASECVAVDDGWLVGFNEGEFGAALYWFSQDGKRNYKVSGHQIISFFSHRDSVHAIAGFAHLGLSEGSVIRISRPKARAHWQATTVAKLPFAPCALSLRRDGTMLITLSNALVSIGPDHKIRWLLADAPWGMFYPTSSIISPDEKRLYIGMRQFVGEFDLTTNKFRFLIPSDKFLNKLPKEDEEEIRKQYGD